MGAAVNDLPPLPPPDRTMHQYGKQIDHFTADQMRAYAQAALDALNDELEASLKRMIDAGLGQIPAANSKPATPKVNRRACEACTSALNEVLGGTR